MVFSSQKAEFKSIKLDENEPLKVECDTFINSIRNKNEPITDERRYKCFSFRRFTKISCHLNLII